MASIPPPTAPGTAPLHRAQAPGPTLTRREKAFNIAVWVLFTALWIAFFAALVLGQGSLVDVWHRLRDLPLIIQSVAWLLFLPLAVGLWIWETSWPLVVRLLLIVGLAWVNFYLFYPWKAASR